MKHCQSPKGTPTLSERDKKTFVPDYYNLGHKVVNLILVYLFTNNAFYKIDNVMNNLCGIVSVLVSNCKRLLYVYYCLK